MTFLEDMNRRVRLISGGTHEGWGKIITETGLRADTFWPILKGKKPMPAQLWEYLIQVQP